MKMNSKNTQIQVTTREMKPMFIEIIITPKLIQISIKKVYKNYVYFPLIETLKKMSRYVCCCYY